METFKDLGLPNFIAETLDSLGYKTPTHVQAAAIPEALLGKNIIGLSQTGTGKTAAFLLPIITNLHKGRSRARMPRSLVLCPTRELAAQVLENFTIYSKNTKLTSALLIGGVSFKDQDKKLDRGVDVIIATPGRLLDHFSRGKLVMTGIEILAIDEADKMLDMGFIPDVTKILEAIPQARQKILFSATIGNEIEALTKKFLENAHRVEISRSATVTKNVNQSLVFIDRIAEKKLNKSDFLFEYVSKEKALSNAIIFCNRKKEVSHLTNFLKKKKYKAGEIHGDLTQEARTDVVKKFKNGEIKFLIASDVAARGLDITNVSHVINFDVPTNPEDYVHRIGRTGRAGKKGVAITLARKADEQLLNSIELLINEKIHVRTWQRSSLKSNLEDKGSYSKIHSGIQNETEKPFLPNFLFINFESQ